MSDRFLLTYDFRCVGVDRVASSLATIEKRVLLHNQRMTRLTGSTNRTRNVDPSTIAKRDADKLARVAEQHERRKIAIQNRSFMMEQRLREKSEREQIRSIKRVEAEQKRAAAAAARSTVRLRESFARGTIGTASRSVGSSVRAIGGMGAGALALGGGFAVAGAIQHAKSLNKAITGLANQAYREGGPSREAITKRIRGRVEAIGAGGEGSANVAEGLRTYVAKTGDLDTGLGIAQFATDLATASDANITDVFDTAGSIMLELGKRGIEGAEAVQHLTDALSVIGGQAKTGSVEFADLAKDMAKVAAATSKFGDRESFQDAFATTGALTQLAISGGAPDASEATTAVMRLADDLIERSDRFKNIGVDVFRKDKNGVRVGLRNQIDILEDVFKKTGGDLGKVQDLFGIRGMKAASPVIDMARNLGGGDVTKGIELMRQEVARFKDAKMSGKEISDSAAFRRAQADMQLDAAVEQFNTAIGHELLPVLTRLIPKFVELIPTLTRAAELFGKFVDELSSKPVATIGKLIAAKLVLDLASAGIGSAVRSAIVASVAGGGAGVAGAGGVAGATGKTSLAGVTNAVGAGVGVGAAVGGAILGGGISTFEETEAQATAGLKNLAYIREGSTVAGAQEALAQEQKRLLAMKNVDGSWGSSLFKAFTDMTPLGRIYKHTVDDPARSSAINTQTNTVSEMEAEVARKQAEAADKQMQAANKTYEAASLLAGGSRSGVAVNRSNSPSPVKP